MNIMSDINTNYITKIGKTISKLRKFNKMSQEELAELSNVHRTYLSDVEGGKRNLTISVLKKIVNSFDIELSVFFEMVEQESDDNYD